MNLTTIIILMNGSNNNLPSEILWGNEVYLMGSTSITFNS